MTPPSKSFSRCWCVMGTKSLNTTRGLLGWNAKSRSMHPFESYFYFGFLIVLHVQFSKRKMPSMVQIRCSSHMDGVPSSHLALGWNMVHLVQFIFFYWVIFLTDLQGSSYIYHRVMIQTRDIQNSPVFLEPLFPMTFFRRDRFHLVHNITHKLSTVFSFEQKNAQTLSISLVKITFLQENTVLSLCVTLWATGLTLCKTTTSRKKVIPDFFDGITSCNWERSGIQFGIGLLQSTLFLPQQFCAITPSFVQMKSSVVTLWLKMK